MAKSEPDAESAENASKSSKSSKNKKAGRRIGPAIVGAATLVVTGLLVVHGSPARPSYADPVALAGAAADLAGSGGDQPPAAAVGPAASVPMAVGAQIRACLTGRPRDQPRAAGDCLAADGLDVLRGRVASMEGRTLTVARPGGSRLTAIVDPATVWRGVSGPDGIVAGEAVTLVVRSGTAVLVRVRNGA